MSWTRTITEIVFKGKKMGPVWKKGTTAVGERWEGAMGLKMTKILQTCLKVSKNNKLIRKMTKWLDMSRMLHGKDKSLLGRITVSQRPSKAPPSASYLKVANSTGFSPAYYRGRNSTRRPQRLFMKGHLWEVHRDQSRRLRSLLEEVFHINNV